jgi:hypothetical protein
MNPQNGMIHDMPILGLAWESCEKKWHFDLTFVYSYKIYYREEVFLSPSCGESNMFEVVHGLFMHAQFWLKIT